MCQLPGLVQDIFDESLGFQRLPISAMAAWYSSGSGTATKVLMAAII
jgi:hypothetical protein